MAIKAMNSIIPAIILLIGIIVFRAYPLTEKKFDSIVDVLAAKRAVVQPVVE
jgi:Na+/melibiose symporter-like transporter